MSYQGQLIAFSILVSILAVLLWVWQRIHKITLKIRRSNEDFVPKARNGISVISLSDEEKKYECGHRNLSHFTIIFWGDEISGKGSPYCHNCVIEELQDGAIRCYECGLPIFISDPVALYTARRFSRHKNVTVIDGQVVCCLRQSCASSGAGFVGHWNGQGINYHFPSGNSIAAEALATGKPQSVELP